MQAGPPRGATNSSVARGRWPLVPLRARPRKKARFFLKKRLGAAPWWDTACHALLRRPPLAPPLSLPLSSLRRKRKPPHCSLCGCNRPLPCCCLALWSTSLGHERASPPRRLHSGPWPGGVPASAWALATCCRRPRCTGRSPA